MSTLLPQPSAFEQIINNADAAINALQQEEQSLNARLQAIQSERATILEKRKARHHQVEQAKQNAKKVLALFDAQEMRAKFATGTEASQESNAPLREQMELAARLAVERDQLIDRATMEDDQDDARLKDLDREEARTRRRLDDVARETIAAARAKADTLRDYGLHQYREYVEKMKLADQDIAEIEQDLADARAARMEIYHAALAALEPWPNHQAEIRKMVAYDDPITATLEAALAYIDALLTHGRALPVNLQVSALSPYYYTLDSLLRVPQRETFGYQTIRDDPSWLRERRGHMAAVLAEYREQKQKG